MGEIFEELLDKNRPPPIASDYHQSIAAFKGGEEREVRVRRTNQPWAVDVIVGGLAYEADYCARDIGDYGYIDSFPRVEKRILEDTGLQLKACGSCKNFANRRRDHVGGGGEYCKKDLVHVTKHPLQLCKQYEYLEPGKRWYMTRLKRRD